MHVPHYHEPLMMMLQMLRGSDLQTMSLKCSSKAITVGGTLKLLPLNNPIRD